MAAADVPSVSRLPCHLLLQSLRFIRSFAVLLAPFYHSPTIDMWLPSSRNQLTCPPGFSGRPHVGRSVRPRCIYLDQASLNGPPTIVVQPRCTVVLPQHRIAATAASWPVRRGKE